jgi:hypothetical protein
MGTIITLTDSEPAIQSGGKVDLVAKTSTHIAEGQIIYYPHGNSRIYELLITSVRLNGSKCYLTLLPLDSRLRVDGISRGTIMSFGGNIYTNKTHLNNNKL